MAATVEIQVCHGSGTCTAKSTVRFKAADDDEANTNNPLVKPTGSNLNYSFEKIFRLYVSQPPSNSLSTLRFHRVTGLPTGITDKYGTRAWGQYSNPVGTQSLIALNTQNVPTTATQIDNSTFTPTTSTGGATNGIGQYGPYLYIQWVIDSTATAGTTTPVTYRWTFDEA